MRVSPKAVAALLPLMAFLAGCSDTNEEEVSDTALPNYPEERVIEGVAEDAPVDPDGADQAGTEDVTPDAESTGSTVPASPSD